MKKHEADNKMTKTELETLEAQGAVRRIHTSYHRSYVSRKIDGVVTPYSGMFGSGYVLMEPNWASTTYSFITYFIEEATP